MPKFISARESGGHPVIFLNFKCEKIILEHHGKFLEKLKTESVLKMHRAYQPITPANNKLLKKRWDQRSYDLHRSKVGD